jgi:hypothetical protein
MLVLAILAPLRHGAIGVLDEVELCLAPFAVMITLWMLRLLSLRHDPKRDRQRSQAKNSTNGRRKDR